jgi:uncharacterized protein (DUF362 family)
MTMNRERRRLLEGLVAVAGMAVTGCAKGATAPKRDAGHRKPTSSQRGLVVRARRQDVRDESSGKIDKSRLKSALGAVIARSTGDSTPESAFSRLFHATDVVGIKVGTLAGPGLSPHPELVQQLVEWLVAAGVKRENVVIWDRLDNELERAGFKLNRERSGLRCLGTNQDYDWSPREWGAGGSCFAGLLVNELTALINVAVVKDHDLAGVSAGLKNWYGVIHNPNKYHDNGGDPYIAQLAAFPLIKDKLRLTVLDALVAQCHGGPARSPRWAWPCGVILASTDPVALDTVAWKIIEERRQQVGLKTLAAEQREPKWIATAGSGGLGEHRWDHIEMVDV